MSRKKANHTKTDQWFAEFERRYCNSDGELERDENCNQRTESYKKNNDKSVPEKKKAFTRLSYVGKLPNVRSSDSSMPPNLDLSDFSPIDTKLVKKRLRNSQYRDPLVNREIENKIFGSTNASASSSFTPSTIDTDIKIGKIPKTVERVSIFDSLNFNNFLSFPKGEENKENNWQNLCSAGFEPMRPGHVAQIRNQTLGIKSKRYDRGLEIEDLGGF